MKPYTEPRVSLLLALVLALLNAPVQVAAGERLYPGSPIPNGADCPPGQFALGIDGSGNAVGCTAESDPQVGTLTNTKWCTTDGTDIDCATDAPVLTEADPTLTNDGAITLGDGTAAAVTATFNGTGTTDGTIAYDATNGEFEVMNGEFGIGTTGPTNPFHVYSNTVSQALLQAVSGDTNAQLALMPSGNGVGVVKTGANDLTFQAANAEHMRIQSTTGLVGIGTTAPAALLHGKGTLSSALTGTVTVSASDNVVTGSGTSFSTELAVGDAIKIGSETFVVQTLTDDTHLTLDSNHQAGASGVAAYRDPVLFQIDNGDAAARVTINRSGQMQLPSKGLELTESDNNPACAAGNYTIFADLSDTKLKKCTNGAVTDLDTATSALAFSAITAGTNTNALVVGANGTLTANTGTITYASTGIVNANQFKGNTTIAAADTADALRDRTIGVSCPGTLAASLSCEELRPRIPAACTIQRIDLAVTTAPGTQAIIVDPLECSAPGTCSTLDSGTKPQIAASALSGSDTAFTDTALAAGNYLAFDITQVGSGPPGSHLTISVTCRVD